jgi:hypothetical protein
LTIPGRPAWLDAWSPDGRYLWLMGGPGGAASIVDMTGPRLLRELPPPGGSATNASWSTSLWSTDGQRIMLFSYSPEAQRGHASGHRLLWTARADGSGLKKVEEVSDGRDFWPCGWTRDGKIIALRKQTRLVAIDPDTGVEKDLLVVPAEATP